MKKQIILFFSFLILVSCKKEYTVEVYEQVDKSFWVSDSKTNTHKIKAINDNDAYEQGFTFYLGSKRANKMLEEKGIITNETVTGFNVYNSKKENIKDNISYEFIVELEKKYKFALE